MNVKDLVKKKDNKQEIPKETGASLVKGLLSKSMSKGGKLKAIKVKVKFGEKDSKKDK